MRWFVSIGVGMAFFITSLTIAYFHVDSVRQLIQSCRPRTLYNRLLCFFIMKWSGLGTWAGAIILRNHPSDEELRMLYERVPSLRNAMISVLIDRINRDVEPEFGAWLADALLCWAYLHRMTYYSPKEQEMALAIIPKAKQLLNDSFRRIMEIHDDISPQYLVFVTIWSNDDEVKMRAGEKLLQLNLPKTSLFVLAERVSGLWPKIAAMLEERSLTCDELEMVARHVPTAQWAIKKWCMIRKLQEISATQ